MSRKKPPGDKNNLADWRKRVGRRKLKGLLVRFFLLAVFAVALGAGIVYKDKLLPRKREAVKEDRTILPPKPAPTAVAATATAATRIIAPPAPTATKPAATRWLPPARPATGPADETARRRLQEAEKQLAQLRFGEARRIAKEAAGLENLGAQMHQLSSELERQAQVFQEATDFIEVVPHAAEEPPPGQRLYRVPLQTGSVQTGLAYPPTNELIKLQLVLDNPACKGKVFLPIKREDWAQEPEPLELEELRKDFRAFLDRTVSRINFTQARDYYDAVYLAKRLNLKPECLDYLRAAYRLDENLHQVFRDEVIARAMHEANAYLAVSRPSLAQKALEEMHRLLRGYPRAEEAYRDGLTQIERMRQINYVSTVEVTKAVPAAEDAKALARHKVAEAATGNQEAPKEFKAKDILAAGPETAQVQKANRLFEEALVDYRKAYHEGDMAAARRASQNFEQVITICENLADQGHPQKDALQSRSVEAGRLLYALRYKMASVATSVRHLQRH